MRGDVRDFENQSGFSPVDLGLKPALVEGFAQRVYAAAVAAEGDETGATLKVNDVSKSSCCIALRRDRGGGEESRDIRRRRPQRRRRRRGGRMSWLGKVCLETL